MTPDLPAKHDRLMRRPPERFPVRPCGATRPALMDAGWECTGRGLVVVFTARNYGIDNMPLVLPARALEIIDPEDWWDLPVRPFEGGDHLHMVVPRRPPGPGAIVGDTPMAIGDAMAAFTKIGGTAGGTSLWIGDLHA